MRRFSFSVRHVSHRLISAFIHADARAADSAKRRLAIEAILDDAAMMRDLRCSRRNLGMMRR
jgi:hypothetical protein